MARTYKPKNPMCPGSKLTLEELRALIVLYLTHRPAAEAARVVAASTNTVERYYRGVGQRVEALLAGRYVPATRQAIEESKNRRFALLVRYALAKKMWSAVSTEIAINVFGRLHYGHMNEWPKFSFHDYKRYRDGGKKVRAQLTLIEDAVFERLMNVEKNCRGFTEQNFDGYQAAVRFLLLCLEVTQGYEDKLLAGGGVDLPPHIKKSNSPSADLTRGTAFGVMTVALMASFERFPLRL